VIRWLLIGLLTGIAWAQEVPLDLATALQQLQAGHPRLKAAQARLEQAGIAQQWAGAPPSAQLGVASWQGRGDALINSNYTALNRPDYYVFMQQSLHPFGQPATRRKLAEQEQETLKAEVEQLHLQLTQQLKDTFYRLLAAQEQCKFARENLDLAEDLLEVARQKLRAGSGPRLDEVNAQIQRNRARQELALLESGLRQQQIALATFLSLASDTRLVCVGELEAPQPQSELEQPTELQDHPRVRWARSSLEATVTQKDLAQQQGNPTPAVSAIYDLVRPSYSVNLSLAIPLDWGQIGSEVAQKEKQIEEKTALLRLEEQQLGGERAQAWQAYLVAYDQAEAYQREILSPAEETTRITRYGYQRGALPYFQLLTSQQQLAAIRKDYVGRLLEAHLAKHALEAALGFR